MSSLTSFSFITLTLFEGEISSVKEEEEKVLGFCQRTPGTIRTFRMS